MKRENVKEIFMAGFHFARSYSADDYDDERCYQKWLVEDADGIKGEDDVDFYKCMNQQEEG